MSRRKYDGRLFHTCRPAAVKLLSLYVGAWYDTSPVNCWSEKAPATVSDKVDIVS